MSLERAKSMEAGLQTMVTNEIKEIEENEKTKKSLCQKIKVVFTNITVEPIMMCYILPSVMSTVATQNLSLEKSCRVNLNFNKTICDALTNKNESFPNYKSYEKDIQRLAADFAIYKNILQSVFPAMILLFLGSWSDRHKRRKPCILLPIMGEIAGCLALLVCTFFFLELPLQFNIFAESLPFLTGGWFSMFMGVFSYISCITTEKQRTLRIGAVNMFSNVSICAGIALSGILYQKIGFYGVYVSNMVLYLCGLFYGVCLVDDIPKTEEDAALEIKNRRYNNFLLDFFDIRYIKDTVKVVFKKGEKNRRTRVLWIMILVMFIIGPIHGEMNVVYYFGKFKFGWDSIDYSLFSTFQFVIHIFGTLFSLAFFTKYLKVDDAVLGMISSTSKILASLVYAFAPTTFYFYIGAVLEFLNGTSFIAMRSIISRLVPPDELGKVNSIFGICEAIIPLVYGPLYNIVYSKTIEFMPGCFFLAGGFLTIPAVFIFLWLYSESKKDQALLKLAEGTKLMTDDLKDPEAMKPQNGEEKN